MKLAQDSTQSERRRSPRKGNIIEGWLSPYDSPDRTEVTTFDLSRHGVSFDSPAAIPVGAQFIYEIGFGEQTLVCDIRVVSCKPSGDKIWHIGAKFI
jgi:PilZ domain